MDISQYRDEWRDFSLLLSNQLLLGIFMTELPIESYHVEVGTKECEKQGVPLILVYVWYGGANTELGDTRRRFKLSTHIKEEDDFDFKIIFSLEWSQIGDFDTPDKSEERFFVFTPNDKSGEAIVNETLIWLRKQMIEVMSGSN